MTYTPMAFADAAKLALPNATDADLVAGWHAYALQISFHHADDTGKEWGAASALMERARNIERAIRGRGLARPTGEYLMASNDRIDWETGEWSRGWHYAKLAAAKAGDHHA